MEKALSELDIYKTPLVPTRLRTANPSTSTSIIPDMFKPRRTSQLILMNDDRKKEKSPKSNVSVSPYAGQGGMKKLLARRKQEEGKDDENEETSMAMEGQAGPSEPAPVDVPAPPPTSDWFSVASTVAGSTSGGSSLRVGRSKTSRNHIARPAVSRSSRLKFSAVYEEDGDDAMNGDDERERERAMLDEASKKLPTFSFPPGFSFAKPEVISFCLLNLGNSLIHLRPGYTSPERSDERERTPDLFSALLFWQACTTPGVEQARGVKLTKREYRERSSEAFPLARGSPPFGLHP